VVADYWPAGHALSPSPADRARLVLLDDATLTNAEVALRARCKPSQAARVRQCLVELGVIMPSRVLPPRAPGPRAMPRMPWLAGAACIGHPGRWWTSPDPADRAKAIEACASCPVREPCLDWAVSALPQDDTAIYGGLTASQRLLLRYQREGRPIPYSMTDAGKNAARQRRRAEAARRAEGGAA
jgi:hypothetical protein